MTRSNQQLMRSVLGAILSSGLTDQELRVLVREFRSGRLPIELADFLDALLGRTSVQRPFTSSRRLTVSNVRQAEVAAVRRHISKSALRDLILTFTPASVRQRLPDEATSRQLLQTFFDEVPDDVAQTFLATLEAGKIEDPFLKGIRERRQE